MAVVFTNLCRGKYLVFRKELYDRLPISVKHETNVQLFIEKCKKNLLNRTYYQMKELT